MKSEAEPLPVPVALANLKIGGRRPASHGALAAVMEFTITERLNYTTKEVGRDEVEQQYYILVDIWIVAS